MRERRQSCKRRHWQTTTRLQRAGPMAPGAHLQGTGPDPIYRAGSGRPGWWLGPQPRILNSREYQYGGVPTYFLWKTATNQTPESRARFVQTAPKFFSPKLALYKPNSAYYYRSMAEHPDNPTSMLAERAKALRTRMASQHPFHEQLAEVHERLGGIDGLQEWAEDNPGAFYQMMMKAAPPPAPQTKPQGGMNLHLSLHPSLAPGPLDMGMTYENDETDEND